MPEVGSTWVTVLPDMRRFNTDLSRQATTSGDSAGKSFGSTFAKAASVGLAVFGAARLFGGMIQDASDLSESVNKIGAVFGDASNSIQDFAAAGAQNLGQSQQQVLDAAATFGVYGKAAGLAGSANADFSTELVNVSADLASFYNTSPEQAIEAIGSALRGEAEPLRQYGVLLDDASLRQEAMKQGLIATTAEALTPQQKVLAAHALILEQTGIAQGDFAKTSDGLANQQRILAATFENVKTSIGTALLPFVLEAISGISALVEALRTGESDASGFAGVMGDVGVVLGAVVGFIKDNVTWLGPLAAGILAAVVAVKAWTAAQLIFNLVLNANPITLIITAIGLLVGAFIWAWTTSETFRDVVTGVWDAVSGAFLGAWENVISPVFTWIGEAVGNTVGFFTGMGGTIGSVWQGIQDVLGAGWNWIRDNVFAPFGAIFGTIGDAFATFGGTTAAIWTDIQQIFVEAVNGVIGFINGFLDAINWVGEQVGLDFGLHIGYIPIPGLGPGIAGPSGGMAFAEGGVVPGRGDKDSVAAWLMPEEIVMRKDIAKPFKNFLLALNAGQAEAIQAAGGRGGRGPQRFATGGTVQSAQDWARANSGRPYVWGGVGPAGWDCSGWQSDIANHLLGTPMGVRRFATGSMAGGVNAGGYVRGEDGDYTIGVNTPGLVAAIGHTAGTLGDLNVESGSGHGGIIGGNALGTNSGFAYKYYLPGSYGFDAAMEARAAQQHFAVPMSGGFSPGELFAGVANFMMDALADQSEYAGGPWSSVGGRVGPATPRTYDRGGILRDGDVAANHSGRDELILDPSQTAAFLGGGGPVRIEGSVRLSADGTLLEFVNAVITRSDGAKTVRRRAEQRTAR